MGKWNWLPLSIALGLVFTGCMTEREWGTWRGEWATWRAHPTHYASNDHMAFSMTNSVAGAPRITPEMVQQAKIEGWWGLTIPSDAQLANVAGTWHGEWRGYGLLHSQRYGIASATFTQKGAIGGGRLALTDAQAAEGVPIALRENSSLGVPVVISVNEAEMWMNNAEPRRPFAATFVLEGDRLVGTFLYTNSPVRIEMTRQP